MDFGSTGLDPRLLRALGKRGFTKPTPVQVRRLSRGAGEQPHKHVDTATMQLHMHAGPKGQPRRAAAAAAACSSLASSPPPQAECIPKALEGRDIVARARTGSGKTLAYLLPALHRVLAAGKGTASLQALVLVPTRELCEQVRACMSYLVQDSCAGDGRADDFRMHACVIWHLASLRRPPSPHPPHPHPHPHPTPTPPVQVKAEASSIAALCGGGLSVSAIAGDAPLRALCAAAGQLVVTTPAKLAQAVQQGIITPATLQERLQVRPRVRPME